MKEEVARTSRVIVGLAEAASSVHPPNKVSAMLRSVDPACMYLQ